MDKSSHRMKSQKASHRERTRSSSGGRHGYGAAPVVVPDDKGNRHKHDSVLEDLMTELIDEIALGLCFEVHRGCRMGTYMLEDLEDNAKKYEIVVQKGRDVFGVIPSKRHMPECRCPHCYRSLAASRFAPHLEKCMGMGRNSSRLASRRIASVKVKNMESDDSESDNEKDDDWSSVASSRKAKKLKKERSHHSGRKHKSKNKSSDDIPSVGSVASDVSSNSSHAYESLSYEERKTILSQTCGVISEHTKKMCGKSLKCPQHTDQQRKHVRQKLLPSTHSDGIEEVQIDIDGYSDTDKSLRDVLHWKSLPQPSPSDSNSTINSLSSSHHKKSHSKKSSKSKGSKRSHKSSAKWPSGAPSGPPPPQPHHQQSQQQPHGHKTVESSDSNASSVYNY